MFGRCSSPARNLPEGRSKIHLICSSLFAVLTFMQSCIFTTSFVSPGFPYSLTKSFSSNLYPYYLIFPFLEYHSSLGEPGSQNFTLQLESTPFACSSSVKTVNHATGFPGTPAHRRKVMRLNFCFAENPNTTTFQISRNISELFKVPYGHLISHYFLLSFWSDSFDLWPAVLLRQPQGTSAMAVFNQRTTNRALHMELLSWVN